MAVRSENGVGGVSSLHQGIGPKALHPWILSSVDSASGESVTAWVDRLHRGIEHRLLHGWILHWGIMCAFNVSLEKKNNSPLRQRYPGSPHLSIPPVAHGGDF